MFSESVGSFPRGNLQAAGPTCSTTLYCPKYRMDFKNATSAIAIMNVRSVLNQPFRTVGTCRTPDIVDRVNLEGCSRIEYSTNPCKETPAQQSRHHRRVGRRQSRQSKCLSKIPSMSKKVRAGLQSSRWGKTMRPCRIPNLRQAIARRQHRNRRRQVASPIEKRLDRGPRYSNEDSSRRSPLQ